MSPNTARILVIGSGSAEGRSALAALAGARPDAFIIEPARPLADGLERLRGSGIAAALLDGPEFDGQREAAIERIRAVAPYVPILAIGDGTEAIASRHGTDRGAHESVSRDRLDGETLWRALTRIVERQAVDEALFFEQQRAQVTLSSIGDAVLTTDLPGNVTYLNPVAERMTGWSRQEATGRPLQEVFRIIDGRTRRTARDPLTQAIRLDRTVGLTPNCLLVRRDGIETAIEDSASPIHDRRGQVIGAVIVFKDVAEARATTQLNVHRAQHDPLTDLPNRLLFSDRLTQAIAMARRRGHRLAVMFLDLDRFKHVNDSLGHQVGDMLLQSVARRLVGCVRASDTVSRQGGDEFVVLLSQIEHADDAAASARTILAALVPPHDIANRQLHISVTIGIGVYPDDGPDAEALIRCADAAMYHAKGRGRNGFRFFERDMRGPLLQPAAAGQRVYAVPPRRRGGHGGADHGRESRLPTGG
jgi:diguanylate cyclase (GGDEF)-like protein/PAS domain S-box-containing protein